MSDDYLMKLLAQWDDVSAAIDRIVTALPGQMTDAAANLEVQRSKMRRTINEVTRSTSAGRLALKNQESDRG